jgi:hypothetical protein
MWNGREEGDTTKVRCISAFKCENGFGVESLIAVGESSETRRYIAPNLDAVMDLVSKFFNGELDE